MLRGGVTLLEVLISMFVLAVGLLGIASLLPVAGYYGAQARNYDRAATLGQQVLHEMMIRDYLYPKSWLDTTGNYAVKVVPGAPGLPTTSNFSSGATMAPFLPPVVIDPLGVSFAQFAGQAPAPLFPAFPVPIAGATAGASPVQLPGAPTIYRLTLDSARSWPAEEQFSPGGQIPMGPPTLLGLFPFAQRLFSSNDDLVFISPENAVYRPFSTNASPNGSQLPDYQFIYTLTGTGPPPTNAPIYTLAFNNTNNNVPANLPSNLGMPTPDFTGDYSWFLTVSPDLDDLFQQDMANMDRYTAALVICYKRDLNLDQTIPPGVSTLDVKKAPPERMVFADLLDASVQASTGSLVPTNFSGGAVRLRTAVAPQWLDVKPNEWLMLSAFMFNPAAGSVVVAPLPGFTQTPPPIMPPLFTTNFAPVPAVQWYRIAGVGETLPIQGGGGWYRDVQLAGPDWNNALYVPQLYGPYVAPDQPSGYPVLYQYATLVTGAIAVYETNITLDNSILKD